MNAVPGDQVSLFLPPVHTQKHQSKRLHYPFHGAFRDTPYDSFALSAVLFCGCRVPSFFTAARFLRRALELVPLLPKEAPIPKSARGSPQGSPHGFPGLTFAAAAATADGSAPTPWLCAIRRDLAVCEFMLGNTTGSVTLFEQTRKAILEAADLDQLCADAMIQAAPRPPSPLSSSVDSSSGFPGVLTAIYGAILGEMWRKCSTVSGLGGNGGEGCTLDTL